MRFRMNDTMTTKLSYAIGDIVKYNPEYTNDINTGIILSVMFDEGLYYYIDGWWYASDYIVGCIEDATEDSLNYIRLFMENEYEENQ